MTTTTNTNTNIDINTENALTVLASLEQRSAKSLTAMVKTWGKKGSKKKDVLVARAFAEFADRFIGGVSVREEGGNCSWTFDGNHFDGGTPAEAAAAIHAHLNPEPAPEPEPEPAQPTLSERLSKLTAKQRYVLRGIAESAMNMGGDFAMADEVSHPLLSDAAYGGVLSSLADAGVVSVWKTEPHADNHTACTHISPVEDDFEEMLAVLDQRFALKDAIEMYPAQFGLKWTQGTFRVSPQASYMADDYKSIQIVVQIQIDGEWKDFARDSHAMTATQVLMPKSRFADKVKDAKDAKEQKKAVKKTGAKRKASAVYALIKDLIERDGGATLAEVIDAYIVLKQQQGTTISPRPSLVSSLSTRIGDMKAMLEGCGLGEIAIEGKGEERRYTMTLNG